MSAIDLPAKARAMWRPARRVSSRRVIGRVLDILTCIIVPAVIAWCVIGAATAAELPLHHIPASVDSSAMAVPITALIVGLLIWRSSRSKK